MQIVLDIWTKVWYNICTMRKSLLVLLFFLSGCVVVPQGQDAPWYASEGLFDACQGADVATTLYAVAHGAVELNPLGLPLIIALKGLVVWMRHDKDDEIKAEGGGVVLNIISCAPVINNLKVIKELK